MMMSNGRAEKQRPKAWNRGLRLAACLSPLILAAGCASFPAMQTVVSRPDGETRFEDETLTGLDQSQTGERRRPSTLSIPRGRAADIPTRLPATDAQIDALIPDEMVDANLAPQSIPQFAATVFGGLLNVPYTLTPDVATRQEAISGGTGGTLNKRQLFRLTQQALKQYGIDVYIDGAFVTVGAAQTSDIGSALTRSRDTPTGAGRVVQFFAVQTIEVNAIQSLLEGLFPNLGGARITPDQLSNNLIISGSTREVAQVVRVLREIDQPRFAGAEVLRVEPVYLSSDVLAQSLDTALSTEGYVVSRQAASGRAITILSFPASNQLLVFSQDPALMERVRFWVDTLDQPAALGDKQSTFVYQVRDTDAQSLGQLAIGQAPANAPAPRPVGVPGTQAVNGQSLQQPQGQAQGTQQGAAGQFQGGRLLVDPINNRILFTGTAAEFASLRQLLRTLDTPAPQVAIEVMVAEVTLTDNTSLGVNLFGTEVRGDGISVGQTGAADAVAGGLLLTFTGPEFRAALSAQASNNRVNILQRPQLVTRSGVAARFQVGTDVPIITSQRATDFQSGGDGTDILQTVQYRQTGVILELTPIVYGDRVDIVINQEISEVGGTSGSISSPAIFNRSLSTQINIADGWTGVLGGLISNNYSKDNTGVPFLKDIPLLGSAFQTNSVEGRRTELLILITPRIIRTNEDMADFADRYAEDMDAAFRTGSGWSYTLTPFSLGPRIRGVGANLPSPERASERTPLFSQPDRTVDIDATDVPPPPPPPAVDTAPLATQPTPVP